MGKPAGLNTSGEFIQTAFEAGFESIFQKIVGLGRRSLKIWLDATVETGIYPGFCKLIENHSSVT
jgi:hypothetical protein